MASNAENDAAEGCCGLIMLIGFGVLAYYYPKIFLPILGVLILIGLFSTPKSKSKSKAKSAGSSEKSAESSKDPDSHYGIDLKKSDADEDYLRAKQDNAEQIAAARERFYREVQLKQQDALNRKDGDDQTHQFVRVINQAKQDAQDKAKIEKEKARNGARGKKSSKVVFGIFGGVLLIGLGYLVFCYPTIVSLVLLLLIIGFAFVIALEIKSSADRSKKKSGKMDGGDIFAAVVFGSFALMLLTGIGFLIFYYPTIAALLMILAIVGVVFLSNSESKSKDRRSENTAESSDDAVSHSGIDLKKHDTDDAGTKTGGESETETEVADYGDAGISKDAAENDFKGYDTEADEDGENNDLDGDDVEVCDEAEEKISEIRKRLIAAAKDKRAAVVTEARDKVSEEAQMRGDGAKPEYYQSRSQNNGNLFKDGTGGITTPSANGKYVRNLPIVNVGALGHTGHGKSTLTAALSILLNRKFGGDMPNLDEIAAPPAERVKGVNINIFRAKYDSAKRHYDHADCSSHADFVKCLITGAARMDAAILVVDACEGPMPQTREHIFLARQIGIAHIIVFLNKCDVVDDEELLELIEMEVRELLTKYKFPGDDTPIIWGSALGALNGERKWVEQIYELAETMDSYIPESVPDVDSSFLLPIEDVFSISGRGTVVTGRIERGIIRVGDSVEIVGIRPTAYTVCTGVEMFRKTLDEGRAGENVGILLRGTRRDEVERGQVLALPGSIKAYTRFEAEVYVLTNEEGGRHTPFLNGYRPQFYFRTTDVTGTIALPEGTEMVMPGDNATINVTLVHPIAMSRGLRFAIREGGHTVGIGVVAATYDLPEDSPPEGTAEKAGTEKKSARQLPVVMVGTIGQADHGKTTLTAALISLLNEKLGGAMLNELSDSTDEEKARGIVPNCPHVEYDTNKRHYAHVDFPTHTDYVRCMITGASQLDCAILVVAVTDGLMPETREQIRLAREVGVPYIIGFLNKCDMVDDEELLELIEMEVRELLTEYKFPGDDIPVIRGSALGALNGERKWVEQIYELAETMDSYIPESVSDVDSPFLLPIEDVFSISGRGTVVTGRIERGIIRVGDSVEIVGIKPTAYTVCTGVEQYRKSLDEGRAGENVGILLRGTRREEVERGQVLAQPGTITAHTRFQARIYVRTRDEGGRHTAFPNGYRPQFYFRTIEVTGTIYLPDGTESVMPGDNVTMNVTLVCPVAMSRGLHFDIREDDRTVGAGVVTEMMD